MTSAAPAAAQFAAPAPAAMGIYDRRHQHQHHPLAAGVWGDHPFIRPDTTASTSNAAAAALPAAMAVAPPPLTEPKFESQHGDDQDDAALQEHASDSFEQEASKPRDKIQRRLAQNREAARKSRLRKKAYIQNLETSRMKLAHLEQEITRARQQGAYINRSSNPATLPAPIDSGVVTFEVEYAQWVEEQGRQTAELRAALQAPAAEGPELRAAVEAALAHYDRLFAAKREAARRDVFFVMSGVWRTGAERFFLWIAGFRPSEVIRVLAPQLEPMTERQAADVRGLQQKARHLEDALSQGMDKLKQTLADSLLAEAVVVSTSCAASPPPPPEEEPSSSAAGDGGCYMAQMGSAMGRLSNLVAFVDHADHLRQETLQNMYKILTLPQAARGLLALGDYCQRLRALSSLWAARPREPA